MKARVQSHVVTDFPTQSSSYSDSIECHAKLTWVDCPIMYKPSQAYNTDEGVGPNPWNGVYIIGYFQS